MTETIKHLIKGLKCGDGTVWDVYNTALLSVCAPIAKAFIETCIEYNYTDETYMNKPPEFMLERGFESIFYNHDREEFVLSTFSDQYGKFGKFTMPASWLDDEHITATFNQLVKDSKRRTLINARSAVVAEISALELRVQHLRSKNLQLDKEIDDLI